MDEAAPAGAAGRRAARTGRQRAGEAAEMVVAAQLLAAGWTILGRNVRAGRSELDIVAREPDGGSVARLLVIVEVRSKTVHAFGGPEESVDAGKVARLYRAGRELLARGELPDGRPIGAMAFRVDLVTVVRDQDDGQWRIHQHLRGLAPP